MSSLREDFTCAVCRDLLYRPVVTTCGHAFCQACLVQMATALRKPTRGHLTTGSDAFGCPCCRTPLELRAVRSKVCVPLSCAITRLFLEPNGVVDVSMTAWAAGRSDEWARASETFEKWWAAYGTWDESMDRDPAAVAELARIGRNPHLCPLPRSLPEGLRTVVVRQAERFGDRSIRQHIVVDDGDESGRMRLTLTIDDFPRTVREGRPFRVAIAALQMQEDEIAAGGAPPMAGEDERTMVRAGADALGRAALTLLLEEVPLELGAAGAAAGDATAGAPTLVRTLRAELRRGIARFPPLTILPPADRPEEDEAMQVSFLLCTVTFYANLAHSLTCSP
jgi:hypothetical protein